jgi:hypothetical protein
VALPTIATSAVAVASHELHELLRSRALLGHGMHMPVVLADALIEVRHLAEQVADDQVGVAGQVFQMLARLAAHHLGLQRQHDPELGQQASDAVDARRAFSDEALPRAVHHQLRLLLLGLDRHEAHVRPLHRLADGRRVGSVVLASLAAHAVRRHQLGRHQPHGVAVRLKLPRPVVRARARFHPNDARRQPRDQRTELAARHLRLAQLHHPTAVHPVNSKHVLGQIDTGGNNGHGPSPSK